jgi:hypothetical protein
VSNFIAAPWSSPQNVFSELVTPPTEEPITLDQAKLAAGLDWATTTPPDPRDAQMLAFIAAARSQVEQDTGLALLTQTRIVTFASVPGDYGLWYYAVPGYVVWAPPGAYIIPLPWQALPLQSMVPITVQPSDGGVTIDPPNGAYGSLPPVGQWQIVSGWADAATLLLEAPLLVHAVTLLTAHYATAGRDLVSDRTQSRVPLGYEEAIAPYRLTWVA